ncbi:hypothetical protein BH11PAT1_BH11PAT1_3750 [soil metagenome]
MAAKKQQTKLVVSDAQKEVQDLRKELQTLQLEHAQFKLKNTSSLAVTRRKLARALTQINMQRKEDVSV